METFFVKDIIALVQPKLTFILFLFCFFNFDVSLTSADTYLVYVALAK